MAVAPALAATGGGTGSGAAGLASAGGGLLQSAMGQNTANKQIKQNQRQMDIEESVLRDKGDIANLILDFIKSSSALDPVKAKAEEASILKKQSKEQQDFLGATQSLPGGGDPRDTVASEQRARLVAAQQDLQIRRNRFLDLELLQAKMQGLLATASIGGIRTPEFGSQSFQKRFNVGGGNSF